MYFSLAQLQRTHIHCKVEKNMIDNLVAKTIVIAAHA